MCGGEALFLTSGRQGAGAGDAVMTLTVGKEQGSGLSPRQCPWRLTRFRSLCPPRSPGAFLSSPGLVGSPAEN